MNAIAAGAEPQGRGLLGGEPQWLNTAEDTQAFGRQLAGLLKAGDLVILTGELGAGKTTLTQGIGEGLGVRGQITSPTFIIARVHPATGAGPALVHADAYRLESLAQLDDLDLDASLEDAVTVVEWGEAYAEHLSQDRLEIELVRGRGTNQGEARRVRVHGIGQRWENRNL